MLKQDFISMYNDECIIIPTNKFKKYPTYVKFTTQQINLNPNSYIKKAKVFRNKKWVDTKPLYLKN